MQTIKEIYQEIAQNNIVPFNEMVSGTALESFRVDDSKDDEVKVLVGNAYENDDVADQSALKYRYRILTNDEERYLIKVARAAKKAQEIAREYAEKGVSLSIEEKRMLGELLMAEKTAKTLLILCNQGIIYTVIGRLGVKNTSSLDISDLAQAGNIGILKAIDKFDLEHENRARFSTFALYWIRHEVQRTIGNTGNIIRLPVGQGDNLRKLLQARKELQQKLGRAPTPEELSKHLGWNLKRVKRVISLPTNVHSLDTTLDKNKEEGKTHLHLVRSKEPNPEELAQKEELKLLFAHLAEYIRPRERRMIELRYGFGIQNPKMPYADGLTLERIGLRYGMTRERVRQILNESHMKMKKASLEYGVGIEEYA